VTQNRCPAAGTKKTLTVTLKFMPALGPVAYLPAFSFTGERPLTDQTPGAIKGFKASKAAECVTRIIDRSLELFAASNVPAVMSLPSSSA